MKRTRTHLYQTRKRMLRELDCVKFRGRIAWQRLFFSFLFFFFSFFENNFADFLDEERVKIFQISSGRWWRFVTATSAIDVVRLKTVGNMWNWIKRVSAKFRFRGPGKAPGVKFYTSWCYFNTGWYYCTTYVVAFNTGIHREIVPPRETVAIARVAIAIVGRGGWRSLPYTVANENQMKA